MVSLIANVNPVMASDEPDGNIMIPASETHVHSWDAGVVKVPATCASKGILAYSCTAEGCTETKEEDIPKTEHKNLERRNVTIDYTGDLYCKDCGQLLERGDSHHWDQGTIVKNPTCENKGVIRYKCTTDGCNGTKEAELPATGHKWNKGTVTKQATCTENGMIVKHCINRECSAETTETTPSLGHGKTELRNVREATCTSNGYTGDTYCMVCKQRLKKGEVTSKLGHQFGEFVRTSEPTTVGDGQEIRTCKRCGAIERQLIDRLPATGNLSLGSFPLKIKSKYTLKAENLGIEDSLVVWSSSNPSVAGVKQDGTVIGRKKGTATISAKLASGKILNAKVKVQKGDVKTTSISVDEKNITLKAKAGYQITAVRYPVTSNQKLTYSSSNKKVATVSKKGWIKAKKVGKAKIYVKSGKKKVCITVKVTK